jgi:hypothetical protein
LLQSGFPALSTTPGVVDVRGGDGGFTQFTGSRGGTGGPGIVRIEAPPDVVLNPAIEANKVLPATGGAGQPPLGNVVHVTNWVPKTTGVSARSGFQSCWLVPTGAIFDVTYLEDDLTDPLNPVVGWDLDIELVGGQVVPFRTLSSFAGGATTPEQLWGNDLGASPIVVRFQGARVVTAPQNPCVDSSNDPSGEFLQGSVGPWLRHSAELNDFWATALPGEPDIAAQRKPNAMRYQIVFDRSHPEAATIVGIRGLRVRCQPD